MSRTTSSTQQSSSSGTAYPPSQGQGSKDSKPSGRGDNWIKVSSRSDTIEVDNSLLASQSINPFKDTKRSTNTQSSRNNTLYVQDSGLGMSSRTSSHQSLSSTNSGSSNGSIENVDPSKSRIVSRLEGSPAQGLEDDWEIVYPDD